jgi:hypothetical protein
VIEVLDGGNGTAAPVVLEAWELYGCYLKGANYGDMNYGSNEAVTIELSIAYDNAAQSQAAALQTSGVGIGLNIGRALGSVVTGVASSNSV